MAIGPGAGDLEGTHSHHHMERGPEGSKTRPLEQTLPVLLPSPLACCRWELGRRHMTPPSNFALRIIVEEDRKLVRTLNANYAGAAPDGGLDECECDALLDVLGLHFTGRPWPRSGGTEASRRYFADVQHGMVAAGWKVDSFVVTA